MSCGASWRAARTDLAARLSNHTTGAHIAVHHTSASPPCEAQGFHRVSADGSASPLATSRFPERLRRGDIRVRARYVGPTRGVVDSASIRTPYPLAPHIPFVSERRRGCPRFQVSPRPGTGRAIGLPFLRTTAGRHKRARVAFCLPSCNGRGDALARNGVVAFVVRADNHPTASCCRLCHWLLSVVNDVKLGRHSSVSDSCPPSTARHSPRTSQTAGRVSTSGVYGVGTQSTIRRGKAVMSGHVKAPTTPAEHRCVTIRCDHEKTPRKISATETDSCE